MKSVKVLGLIVSGLVGLSLTATQAQALKERETAKPGESFKIENYRKGVDGKLERRGEENSREGAERAISSGVTTKEVGVSGNIAKEASDRNLGLLQTQMDKSSCQMSSGLRVMSDAMSAADKTLFDTTMVSTVDLAKSKGIPTIIDGPVYDSVNQSITLLNSGAVAEFVYNNNLTDATLRQGGLMIADAAKTSIASDSYTIVGEFKVPSKVVDLFAERITSGDRQAAEKEVAGFCNGKCDTFSTGVSFCRKAA